MEVTESDLQDLRDMCLEYYNAEDEHIRSIVLYGGAARTFANHDHTPGDFDLNVFFSDQSTINSTHGMPEVIGEYDGLKVEIMRNRVPDEKSIKQYIEEQRSKRWQRIRNEPIVQIYPDIKQVNWQ